VRRLALVVLVALACGSINAHAQTLSLAYHKGDTYKYKLHSTADEAMGEGGTQFSIKVDIKAMETVAVQSVDTQGTADMLIGLSNLTMQYAMNGVTNTTSGQAFPSIDLKVAADGRILSAGTSMFGGSNISSLAGMGQIYMSAVLPDNPVKPGDTWSKEYDQTNPLGSGTSHVTTGSKYLRDETVQGVTAAVVETTSHTSFDLTIDLSMLGRGQMGSAAPSLPGVGSGITLKGTSVTDVTTWVDAASHRVLETHTSGTTDVTMTIKSKSTSTIPGLTGPLTIKGTETMDIAPA
jgi:hypothetical protein